MEKTFTMLVKDTKDALIQICNNSGLPMCILEIILKDIYREVNILTDEQYKKDVVDYQKALKEQNVNITEKENKEDVIITEIYNEE